MDSLPNDPLKPLLLYSPKDIWLSFLIEDGVYYDFNIIKITSIKDGKLIHVYARIDSMNVNAYIVSKKPLQHDVGNTIKIKEGETYPLSLNRYFFYPQPWYDCCGKTLDIMLGNTTMHINSWGFHFSYLFLANNLDGLKLKDTNQVNFEKQTYLDEFPKIDQCISDFVKAISLGNKGELQKHIDSLQIKKTLKQYGNYGFNAFDDPKKLSAPLPHDKYMKRWNKISKNQKWVEYPPIKKYNWRQAGVNSNSFDEMFQEVLRIDYSLPITDTTLLPNIIISDVKINLLYCSDNIYTVRVSWAIPSIKKSYIAIINVKQYGDIYKVIGFNKPYTLYFKGISGTATDVYMPE